MYWLLSFLAQLPTPTAPEGGWPVTVSGWVTLLGFIATFLFLVYDRVFGKAKAIAKVDGNIERLTEKLQSLDTRLCSQIEDVEQTQKVMDGHLATLSTNVRDLAREWQGVDGQNGWKSIVRKIREEVTSLNDDKKERDAIAKHEREQMREHGRRPQRLRDRLDEGHDN